MTQNQIVFKPFETQYILPMNLKIIRIAFFLVSAAGCSSIAAPDSASNSGLVPDYRRIVLRDLQAGRGQSAPKEASDDKAATPGKPNRSVFLNVERLGRVEISEVSQVLHSTRGWVWLTCIRSYPDGRPSTDYAIFISNNKIVDARTSVITDNCSTQKYELLTVIPLVRSRSPIY